MGSFLYLMFLADCNSLGEPFGKPQGQRDETVGDCMAASKV